MKRLFIADALYAPPSVGALAWELSIKAVAAKKEVDPTKGELWQRPGVLSVARSDYYNVNQMKNTHKNKVNGYTVKSVREVYRTSALLARCVVLHFGIGLRV